MKAFLPVKFRSWTVPIALLGLSIAAFGIMLPTLGFYWDDWAKILVSRLWGLQGYWAYYASDRPLSAWTHILLTPILGPSPLPWQIFTLLMRWLTAVGLWWTLCLLWPQARRAAGFTAALFLVYPIFLQQAVALTFHQQWLQYALFFLSLGAMLMAMRQAQRRSAWLWTGLSLAASLLQLTVTEYFVGLELIRPVLIWIAVGAQNPGLSLRKRAFATLKIYAPYLLLFGFYVIWRMFLIRLPGADPYKANTLYSLLAHPLSTMRQLVSASYKDLQAILITTWTQLISFDLTPLRSPFNLLTAGVAILSAAALCFYWLKLDETDMGTQREQNAWIWQALAVGLVATLVGMIPGWATGRYALDDFHANRYAQPAMFGASLLWVALIEWVAQRRLQKVVLMSVGIGLAVALQLHTANYYRTIWHNQTQFYWQLSWRAPYLQPGTALVFENEPFPNQGLFSTSAAINQMYPQPADPPSIGAAEPQLAYWVYTLLPRWSTKKAADVSNANLHTQFRTLAYNGNMNEALLVDNAPVHGHCAWVLDPSDGQEPYLSGLVKNMLAVSHPEQIVPQAPEAGFPPAIMIGKEPAGSWCYFFEKADLAKQLQDWARAVQLGDAAQAQGFTPTAAGSDSPHEWMPFIEAYARTGRWEDAQKLTVISFKQDPAYASALCSLWKKIDLSTAGAGKAVAMEAVNASVGCQP